jgi:hypothetical protein
MKKIILILITVILTGCAGTYKQASYVSNKIYLGMPISEFRKLAGKKASLEAMESGYTVYRINDYDAWSGARTDTKFYYFDSNAKLVKVDSGEFKQKRYQIEIIKS